MAMGGLGRIFTVVRGVAYAAAFVGLWAWLALSVRRYDTGIAVDVPRWLGPVGIALASAGALLAAACVAVFVTRGRGTPAPFDPPRVFIASGPFRCVRNPMYVGWFAVILGAGLVFRSPSMLILAVGFLLAAHLLVVLYEEPALIARFGDSYREYRKSVPRWFITRPKSRGSPRAG